MISYTLECLLNKYAHGLCSILFSAKLLGQLSVDIEILSPSLENFTLLTMYLRLLYAQNSSFVAQLTSRAGITVMPSCLLRTWL